MSRPPVAQPTASAPAIRRGTIRTIAGPLAGALAVFALAACRTAVPTYPSSDPRPAETTLLTPDGTDEYAYTSSAGAMEVVALDTNTAGSLRSAFWPADSPPVVDGQTCATWANQSAPSVQQGAALRIATDNGSTRAVTVTKNILFGATWIFNVHTWDTAATPALQPAGSISLKPELWPDDEEAPLPWNVCVRVIGATLDLKVWRGDETEPGWGDTTHGGSVTLAQRWVYPGATGWYIGHLTAGERTDFTNLATWKYVLTSPPSTPTTAGADLRSTSAGSGGAVSITGRGARG